MTMLVAGVRMFGGKVEMLEVDEPRPLAADEVLIEVRSTGIGNWDDIIRTGGWDVGASPPLALGVEAAGVIRLLAPAPADSVWTMRCCATLCPCATKVRGRRL